MSEQIQYEFDFVKHLDSDKNQNEKNIEIEIE